MRGARRPVPRAAPAGAAGRRRRSWRWSAPTHIDRDRSRCHHAARILISVDTEEAVMSQALDPVTQRHVDNLTKGLVDEFAGIFSAETIHRYISESVDLLGDSK